MPAATNSFSPEQQPIPLRVAQTRDAEAITQLINEAFVVERIAFDGNRIDAQGVIEYMKNGVFLLAHDHIDLAGCVYVEVRGEWSYLGLLSVAPARQGTGLGRRLVEAAEKYSREAGCRTMDLRIISPRVESLLSFYQRLGYEKTGTLPLASGATPKVPCHYITMAKPLT